MIMVVGRARLDGPIRQAHNLGAMGKGGHIRGRLACAMAMTLVPWGASAVTMEVVTVGDPGNPSDPANTNQVPDIGSVPYIYQIGKYEVINPQYAEFLNAIATTDTYGLYNTSMSNDVKGGIIRSGSSGAYAYSVKPGYERMPVVFVSLYDTVRFVNWLENGQPSGAQGAGTTETGSYTLFTDGSSTTNVTARGVNGTWVIPTENEWYKAAFYDPGPAGPADAYWWYATRSDEWPNSRPPNNFDTNSANYFRDEGWFNDFLNDGYAKTGSRVYYTGTNYMTEVGSYSLAASHYGTYDQSGNVDEWIQTTEVRSRNVWGGSWGSSDDYISSYPWDFAHAPMGHPDNVGFRVAAIMHVPSLAVASLADGAVRLELRGSVGLSHVMEVSGDLTNWQPWAVVTLPAGGWSTNFPVQPDAARLFWRARLGSAPPGFVLIPAGEFQMGNSFDSSEGEADELPRHTVYVSAFYMQATETTKAQWDEVRAWGLTNGYSDLRTGGGKASEHPVQAVSWYDAVKWCNARSEKEGLSPCYVEAIRVGPRLLLQ